jgi:poly-gamma-glutamate synthesis protein (capsule biosynthesis protein)
MIRKTIAVFYLVVFLLIPAMVRGDDSTYLTIIAAGDNLYSDSILNSFAQDDGYNFNPIYEKVKPLIEAADLAFVNQETVFGGKSLGYSGYPRFNTPSEAGTALAAAGFDVVNHANNHAMDKGEAAVFATMDFWDAVPGVRRLGIYRSEEERKEPLIIEKNRIRVGFLSYTYGTNGIPLPPDKPWLVSLTNRDRMAEEIDALRPLCDFLVVSMHWGSEYERSPSAAQKSLAAFLAEHRVDLVIGHHPHVLQGWETLARPDGGNMLCFYSLGNFASAQLTRPTLPTLLGGLMYLRIKKSGGEIHIEETGIIPVLTHFEPGYRNLAVYPLYEYSAALADKHHRKTTEEELSLSYFNSLVQKVLPAAGIISRNPF